MDAPLLPRCSQALPSRVPLALREILVVAPIATGKRPAVPAKKAQSTSGTAAARAASSTLHAPERRPTPRGLSLLFQTCCAPVPPQVRSFLKLGSAPRAPISPASNTPVAAISSPSPVSRVFPARDSLDNHASAAPPASSAAPNPASSAPISSPARRVSPVSQRISVSSASLRYFRSSFLSRLPFLAPIPPLALLRRQPRIPRLRHRRAKRV